MRSNTLLALARGLPVLLAAVAATPAAAGSLQIDPIKVELTPDRKTGTVTIRNQEPTPVTIRAYPLAWSQAEGQDVYEASSAVIVSPPIFTIPAGGSQLIRVGLRGAGAAGQAYRLIVEEVPEASPDTGVRVALRLNLPLYAMVKAGRPDDLVWSVRAGADGSQVLEAVNRGAGYVRVDAALAAAETGLFLDPQTSFGTVLPGGSRAWPIGEALRIADPARFQAIEKAGDGGPRHASRSSD